MAYYEITLTHHRSTFCAADTRENKRQAGAARSALWRAVYAMVEGEALLDRPVAYRLRDEVLAADISPVKRGEHRKLEFRLRQEEAFPHVLLRIMAD